MNYDQLCRKICEIEDKYDLFHLTYNHVAYWKYARYYVYRVLLHKFFGIHTPWLENKKENDFIMQPHFLQKFTDPVFLNEDSAISKDILMFTFNRRSRQGEVYVSSVTDEISLNLESSNCIVEVPYNGGYYQPVPIKNIKYFDPWEGIGLDNGQKSYTPISRGLLRRQLLQIFEKELEISFSLDEKNILNTNINYFILYRQDLMANYHKVIQKVDPKLVLLTTSYIGEWIVLIELLKELKIPSIEILHGYVDENYLPYNYIRQGMNDAQPDYIFVYSQLQKDQVNWGIPKDHIRVAGYPEGEKRSRELLAHPLKRSKKRITFISNMAQVMEKYLNALAENINLSEYDIIFKLHPNEYTCWKEIYKNLSQQIYVIDHNENDIHYYLANSDIVAGINSTALFEATFYPVDIYILQEDTYQNMNFLLRSGTATLVSGSHELLSCIYENSAGKSSNNDIIFRKNSIKNVNSEIKRVLEKESFLSI